MKRFGAFTRDGGNIMIMSVVIVALLVATGMGYMKWSSDERQDSAYEKATVQAYFLAQRGLIQQGLHFLRSRKPTDLPQGTVYLEPGSVAGAGSYYNVLVRRVTGLGQGNVFQRSDTYDIFSTGRAPFYNQQLGGGRQVWVERTARMRARLRSFANYMYLTNFETTRYNEIIWFWTYDSLWGRTHSNDYIGLKYSPHFYGPISTSKEEFRYYQPQNIYFEYPPQFNVPPVFFPRTAATLRGAANPWVNSLNGRMMTRIKMLGAGGINIYQYPLGTPPNEDSLITHIGPQNWGAIFVDGQCEVYGEVSGNLSIGSADDMWLINDIRYTGADERNGWFEEENMSHMLGLISEGDIWIDNVWANGRENGFGRYGPMQTDHHSIIINAGLVALNESFQFYQQNDDWELYQGPTPDERGIIHLKGAVTQYRRGYVHRSNHQGTGYGKDYHYDFRFDNRPPPFYLEAMDEEGHGLFDVISWNELTPTK